MYSIDAARAFQPQALHETFEASASPSFFGGQQFNQLRQLSQPSASLCSPQSLLDDSCRSVSKQAMLVGAVAALSEESGMLRNQWQSDVSRLEQELGQLRCAAAWALPCLGQEPDVNFAGSALQAFADRGGNHSPRGDFTRFPDGMPHGGSSACGGGYSPRRASSVHSSHDVGWFSEAAPSRGSGRQSPRVESRRLNDAVLQMELQEGYGTARDFQVEQAMARDRLMYAGSCSSQVSPCDAARFSDVVPARGSVGLSSLGLSPRGWPQAQESPVELPRLSDVVMQMHNAAFTPARDAPAPEFTPRRGCMSEMGIGRRGPADAAPEVAELRRELDCSERKLRDSQQEVATLREEKHASETAHARDVNALESMLQQVLAENARLTKLAGATCEAGAKLKLDTPIQATDEERLIKLAGATGDVGAKLKVDSPIQATDDEKSTKSVSEPGMEPTP